MKVDENCARWRRFAAVTLIECVPHFGMEEPPLMSWYTEHAMLWSQDVYRGRVTKEKP
jgi:hypothetical protein